MGVVGIDRDEDTDDDHRVNGSIPDLSLRSWVDAYNVGERRWMEAQIVDAYEDRVLLHYKGFRPALDEWVERSSPRIRPFHSYTPARTGASHSQDWCVGHRLMVLDSREMWLTAEIVEVNSTMVKVHYSNMHERYDEWINKDSYRLAELDTDAEALCMIREGVPSSGNSLSGENRALFRATLQDEENFRNLMWTRLNARIVEMDYDGNCLFRAVSHQVYGDPSHHFQVRTFCCSYMEREREFFSNYSTESDFASYLRRMRRAGEWGDHLEIQAMSEIYERPILVYAYSAEPMRTYSNQKTVSNPIRISYHFESHYNSVVVAGSPVVPPPLFYMEQKALTRTSARTQELVNNLAERIDSMEIEKAINESLTNLLEAECKNQSLLEMDAGNDLQAAIEESRKQKEDEEAAMLQSAIALSSADTLLDLPYPIRHCHVELQFPLKDCIDAYTAIRSLSNSDDVDIEHMTDWILNHSFA